MLKKKKDKGRDYAPLYREHRWKVKVLRTNQRNTLTTLLGGDAIHAGRRAETSVRHLLALPAVLIHRRMATEQEKKKKLGPTWTPKALCCSLWAYTGKPLLAHLRTDPQSSPPVVEVLGKATCRVLKASRTTYSKCPCLCMAVLFFFLSFVIVHGVHRKPTMYNGNVSGRRVASMPHPGRCIAFSSPSPCGAVVLYQAP